MYKNARYLKTVQKFQMHTLVLPTEVDAGWLKCHKVKNSVCQFAISTFEIQMKISPISSAI